MFRPTLCLMLTVVGVLAADITWGIRALQNRPGSDTNLADIPPVPGHSTGWQPQIARSGPSAFLDSDHVMPAGDRVPAEPEEDVRYFPDVLMANSQPAATPVPSPSEMTDSESRIWQNELSDLPETQAAEIMALRSQLGSVIDPNDSAWPDHAGPRTLPPTVVSDARPIATSSDPIDAVLLTSATGESPAMQRLRNEATSVYRENQANRMTPGFKRREILIVSASGTGTPPEDDESGTGPTWITRLDLTPGRIRETGNPLDVAIHGRGWLKVSDGDTEGFTRCGILGVDTQGRLCAWTGVGLLPLSPEVNIGTNRQFFIQPDGALWGDEIEGAGESTGPHLTLHTFQNPSALQRGPSGFYVATEASGEATPRPGDSAPGQFLPQALEQSNAQTEREQSELQKILTLPASRPSAVLPAAPQ